MPWTAGLHAVLPRLIIVATSGACKHRPNSSAVAGWQFQAHPIAVHINILAVARFSDRVPLAHLRALKSYMVHCTCLRAHFAEKTSVGFGHFCQWKGVCNVHISQRELLAA
jgi:hypothetical protein